MLEKVLRLRSPIRCGGTRKIRQISSTWNFRVSRNCASLFGSEMGVKDMFSSRMATFEPLEEPP